MPSFQFHSDLRTSIRNSACCSVIVLALIWPGGRVSAGKQSIARPVTVAVLDFGDSNIGRTASEKLASNLKHETSVAIPDRDQVRAAARGAGYTGSINL